MSEQGLFRNNALKAQANKLDGDVIISQPVSASVLLIFLVLAVVTALIFLTTSSFNRKETVSGFLQPDGGVSRVVAPRNGVVSQVLVNDGDLVEQGQPLILLNTPDFLAGGQSLNALMAGNFIDQLNLLNRRKEQTIRQAELQQGELEQRLELLIVQSNDVQQQLGLARERLAINEKRLIDTQALSEQGLLALEEFRKQQELVLNLRQQLAELSVTRQSHRSQLKQLSGELQRLPGETEQQLSMINSEISRIKQQQLELNGRGDFLITAPVGGVVTNLIAEAGQHIQSSRSLLSVIPDDSELKAILLIPTRAYGFIQPGQTTRIRFDAFPYQRFGLFEGQVSRTSRSIVLPDEIQMPISIQEPVYRVEATLAAQEIGAYGDSMPLQAGMLLSADVVLEQRSLLAWLFEPLLSLRGRI